MKLNIVIVLLVLSSSLSCKKFLDEKPKASLVIPSSPQDLAGLLDNYSQMNNIFPPSLDILCDDYYVSFTDYQAIRNEYERKHYIWEQENESLASTSGDWSNSYKSIYIANLVLEEIKNITYSKRDEPLVKYATGAALFYRAFNFYLLAELYGKGYSENTAGGFLGIPLKTSTDITDIPQRATLKETYHKILEDLTEATQLLPVNTSLLTQPSRAAAFGMLSRTYLTMQNYPMAKLYADSCLAIYDYLYDFNSLDSNAAAPFERFNKEVIFHAVGTAVPILASVRCKVDSALYQMYDKNDLRTVMYFKKNTDGSHAFKAFYDGSNSGKSFVGIVADEQYLIAAEANCRLGNDEEARNKLNYLLQKRWRKDNFVPETEAKGSDLLRIILDERRKELLFRGLRLGDLKRLNQDELFKKTLVRNLNGQLYYLEPNAPGYELQIPQVSIDKSGMQPNP